MATIGRRRAVAAVGKLKLSGFIAWLAWLTVHIFYLIDFRSKVVVLFDWAWSYFTYQRGSRLITGHRLDAGAPERARRSRRSRLCRRCRSRRRLCRPQAAIAWSCRAKALKAAQISAG